MSLAFPLWIIIRHLPWVVSSCPSSSRSPKLDPKTSPSIHSARAHLVGGKNREMPYHLQASSMKARSNVQLITTLLHRTQYERLVTPRCCAVYRALVAVWLAVSER